nr:MAG: hypothetical protein DIU70_14770 [Bacillota bacterium]
MCETCTEAEALTLERLDTLISGQQEMQQELVTQLQLLEQRLQALEAGAPYTGYTLSSGATVALQYQIDMGDLLVAGLLLLVAVMVAGQQIYRALRAVLR